MREFEPTNGLPVVSLFLREGRPVVQPASDRHVAIGCAAKLQVHHREVNIRYPRCPGWRVVLAVAHLQPRQNNLAKIGHVNNVTERMARV